MGLKYLTMVREETHNLGPKGLFGGLRIMNDTSNHHTWPPLWIFGVKVGTQITPLIAFEHQGWT